MQVAEEKRSQQLNELDKFQMDAYENAKVSKNEQKDCMINTF